MLTPRSVNETPQTPPLILAHQSAGVGADGAATALPVLVAVPPPVPSPEVGETTDGAW